MGLSISFSAQPRGKFGLGVISTFFFYDSLSLLNAKECSNYHTRALISHGSKVMLKIFQAMFQ